MNIRLEIVGPTGPWTAARGSRQKALPIRPAVKGFTLIELVVVIAIIALLATLLLPSLARAKATG